MRSQFHPVHRMHLQRIKIPYNAVYIPDGEPEESDGLPRIGFFGPGPGISLPIFHSVGCFNFLLYWSTGSDEITSIFTVCSVYIAVFLSGALFFIDASCKVESTHNFRGIMF